MSFCMSSKELHFPNPTRIKDPNWDEFNSFLQERNVHPSNNKALNAYQNCSSGPYLGAYQLNHCLNLEYYGENSGYANMAEGPYGRSLEDYDYNPSVKEIDAEFNKQKLKIHPNTLLYKGISNEVIYQHMGLDSKLVGDALNFPGYLSTTVCLEVAENFAKSNPRIVLVIRGHSGYKAVIPEIKSVLHSPSGNIPEQEVLLPRGLSFRITSISLQASIKYLTIFPV